MLDDIKQDYEFPTEMVELEALNRTDNFGNKNYSVPLDMARACVRTDTGQVLGIHGSKYKPIAHKDVVMRVLLTLWVEKQTGSEASLVEVSLDEV